MSDVSKINVNGTTYDLKDSTARAQIEALPKPVVFKGTLGTTGTITTLPEASASTIGHMYKVITAGTYAGKEAKVGDLFIGTELPSATETWLINDTPAVATGVTTFTVNFNSNNTAYSQMEMTKMTMPGLGTVSTITYGSDTAYSSSHSPNWYNNDYKTITLKTAASGDLLTWLTNNASKVLYDWVLVPSGDEPSGTVTNIATGSGLTGGPITTTGTISVDYTAVQEKLVSGTNIKTINNESILGSGNITAGLEIPEVVITQSQVTSVDPLTIQLTDAQYTLINSSVSKFIKLNATDLGSGTMTFNVEDWETLLYLSSHNGVWDATTSVAAAQQENLFVVNKTTKVGIYSTVYSQPQLIPGNNIDITNNVISWVAPVTSMTTTITGDGSTSLFTIDHSFNTRDLIIQLYELTNYETVEATVKRATTSTITVEFKDAPAVGLNFRVCIYSLNNL